MHMKAGHIFSSPKGFTLIEGLVVLFIFSLITISFYSLISTGSRHIINAKNRLGALALANEKMEVVRNLSYDDIGTDTGAVEGVLEENEDVSKSTRQYHVHTLVEYIDDAFDGEGFGADNVPTDYKIVTITVSWGAGALADEVRLISRFVPQGLEVLDPDHGILSINIFSDQPGGAGIPSSTVRVVNTETGLDTTVETDSTGNVTLMGDRITDSIQKYQIMATKSGYETAITYPPYPETAYNPTDVHASVVTGAMNVFNMVQNKLTALTVKTTDPLGKSLSGVKYALKGGRKLGMTAVPEGEVPNIIYSMDVSETSDADGEKEYDNISPGTYVLTPELEETDPYVLVGIPSYISRELFSEAAGELRVLLAEKSKTGLLVKVGLAGSSPEEALSGAKVHISNGAGFEDELITPAEGAVYFPQNADPFPDGNYTVQVTAEGYAQQEVSAIVSNGNLTVQGVSLSAL